MKMIENCTHGSDIPTINDMGFCYQCEKKVFCATCGKMGNLDHYTCSHDMLGYGYEKKGEYDISAYSIKRGDKKE